MNPALRLVRLLVEVTRTGRIRWIRNAKNPDLYEAQLGPETLTLRFVRFMRTDKAHADRHLVEITAFGITTDHAVGTEGMELAQQMIAMGDAQIRAVRTAIRERVQEAEEILHAILELDAPTTPARGATRGKAAPSASPARTRAVSIKSRTRRIR